MNLHRRRIARAVAATLLLPLHALAQVPLRNAPAGRPWRVGVLSYFHRDGRWEPGWRRDFIALMTARGYAEGRKIAYEWRYAERDMTRLPRLAAELVQLKPDALLSFGSVATRAMARATATIPIVCAVGHAAREGYTGALGRPERNVTGLSTQEPELIQKTLEMLKSIIPAMTRFAILEAAANPAAAEYVQYYEEAARNVGVEPIATLVRSQDEIVHAIETMRRRGIPAAYTWARAGFFKDFASLTRLALDRRVALISPEGGFVEAGGLLGYSAVLDDFEQRIAQQLDKILRGVPVRDVPFEQPTRYRLEVNRKTAKALGYTIPRELLVQADEVFE